MSLSGIRRLSIAGIPLKRLSVNGVPVWKRPYTNLVPSSVDTDGSIFNGCGYLDGYRLSSSGALKESAGSTASGFIPVKGGDVLRIAGVEWYNTALSTNYVCGYDASFTFIGALYSLGGGQSYQTKIWDSVEEFGNRDALVRLKALDSIAYIRVSSMSGSHQTGATMIVTVNEELTE